MHHTAAAKLQNCVFLLNQSLGKAEARWFASWLIKARRLWGLAFQFIPKCDTLGRGTLALALQDVASEEESLVPTFAYLYSGAAVSPPLMCLCSINLRNRAPLVISPRSLFLLISLQNRLTWMLFVQELNVFFLSSCGSGCKLCLKQNQAVRFGFYMLIALSRKKTLCQKTTEKYFCRTAGLVLGRGHVCRRQSLCHHLWSTINCAVELTSIEIKVTVLIPPELLLC